MFISLGYLSKKMLIPLLIPFVYYIRHSLLDLLEEKINLPNDKPKKQSIFLNTFLISISCFLNALLLIIEYNKTKVGESKEDEKENEDFNNQLLIEKEKMMKKQKKNRYIFLILLPLFHFFNYLSYDFVNMFKPEKYNKIFFYPISIPVFFIITAFMSYFLLNNKLYLHHKTSMIISPIFSVLLFILLILIKDLSLESIFFLISCLVLKSLRYILFVLGKKFIDKMFISHIQLMTYLGVFGILFSLIANLISLLINFDNIYDNLEGFFVSKDTGTKRLKTIFDMEDYNLLKWLILFGIIIFWFVENYLTWFCIYTFSPNHYTIYSSINSIGALLIEYFYLPIDEIGIIKLIFFYSFSLFSLCNVFVSGLIFNELLIIRICNLDKNTNVEINKRQKEENSEISLIKFNDDNNNDNPDSSFDSEQRNSNNSNKTD